MASLVTNVYALFFSMIELRNFSMTVICFVLNVYCPECPPGGTFGHPGGQQKKFLPFGHGRDLVAFNGTGL